MCEEADLLRIEHVGGHAERRGRLAQQVDHGFRQRAGAAKRPTVGPSCAQSMMHPHVLGGHRPRPGQCQPSQQDRIGCVIDALDHRADTQHGKHHRDVMQQRATAHHHQLAVRISDGQLSGRVAPQFQDILLIRHSHGCELAIDGARHATHAASWSSSSGESNIGSTSGIVRLP